MSSRSKSKKNNIGINKGHLKYHENNVVIRALSISLITYLNLFK